ncbi:TPA: ATP-binding cassette domain-containing protein [Streptococcus suis]
MKKYFKTIHFLWQTLIEYEPIFFMWYLLDILFTACIPLILLYLSTYILDLLMKGTSVAVFVKELSVRMLIILFLKVIAALTTSKLEEHGEKYRVSFSQKIYVQRVSMDYPLLLDAKAQKLYTESMEVIDHGQAALNMTLNSSRALMGALIAVTLYTHLLMSLDRIFILLIISLSIILILIKIKQQRLAMNLQSEKFENASKNRYLNVIMSNQQVAKDFRLYSMSEWFKSLQNSLVDQYKLIVKPEKYVSQFEGLIILIFLTGMSAIAYHKSVEGIMMGTIENTKFFVYLSLVMLVTTTLTNFISRSADLIINFDQVTVLHDYLSQKNIFNHGIGQPVPKEDFSIHFEDVCYYYPNEDKPVINHLNLTIHPQEKLAIVGDNGAGKTTLIKLLLGLLQPTSGQIYINSSPISDFNIHDYYDFFAPVFQDDHLFTETIKETIIQGYAYDDAKYKKVLENSGMNSIIEKLPKGDKTTIIRQIDPEGVSLSGGQLQRLKLAKALYKDAPVLVLDEPTAALDPIAESEIYQKYLQFSKEKTSIFISHRLASTQFCDRIIYLKDGQILEEGTHSQLIKNRSAYYKMFELQAYYYREGINIKDDKVGEMDEEA